MDRLQILVYPDIPEKWKKASKAPDTEAEKLMFNLLEKIDLLSIPDCLEGNFLRFDKEAQLLCLTNGEQS